MKRRNFLSLIGAATVAPALPTVALGPSPEMMSAATVHAQTYPYVSVMGLSRRVGVSVPEAENLMHAMSRKGIIGPMRINGARPVYAGSQVFVPPHSTAMEAARMQRTKHNAAKKIRADKTRAAKAQSAKTRVDISDLMAHLHALCVSRGMTLHPRCLAVAAA